VKSPKVFFRDSGIFHALQGIGSEQALIAHPKLGASWEGFALEQILSTLRGEEAYFYAIHGGSDLDLYLPNRRVGMEIKRRDVPRMSRSMGIALEDLDLEELIVVYPGERSFELGKKIRAVSVERAVSQIEAWKN
jgi:predicted AAA+ superfamily ATPase